jgi:hypothetical protein
MNNNTNKEPYFQGMDGRWYHTRDEVIAANNEYMETKEQIDAQGMTEFTSGTGCQVWIVVIALLLTIICPPLWFLWWGLACLFFRRS